MAEDANLVSRLDAVFISGSQCAGTVFFQPTACDLVSEVEQFICIGIATSLLVSSFCKNGLMIFVSLPGSKVWCT